MTGRAPQVLLVEDDESLRRILARHLRSHGYDVDEAGSAEEAAAILAEGVRPAVVLLDINLPGDNGWDLLRGPSLAAAGSPPVVISSATDRQPAPPRRIRGRRLSTQAVPTRDAHRDRRTTRRDGRVSDLAVVLIITVAFAGLFGLVWLCGAVRA